MIAPSASRLDLEQALGRFPDDVTAIRELFLADPDFRSACADDRLALQTLARFESRPDAAARPEVTDYRRVIADLEAEIATLIRPGGAAR